MIRTTDQAGNIGGVLEELTTDECWRLLEDHDFGRVAYTGPDGIVVLPMNYLAAGRAIWFRTASYDQLAVHAPRQLVAFQVDHADAAEHRGWSVLVRGRAEHVLADHPLLPSEWDARPPWPEGPRTMKFRISPTHVSGRRLSDGSGAPRSRRRARPGGSRPAAGTGSR